MDINAVKTSYARWAPIYDRTFGAVTRKGRRAAVGYINGLAPASDVLEVDARALDFPDASFDAVAAMHMISVVPEPEQVMAEMVRVLRPGGKLVVTNHFARSEGILARIERWSAPFADLLGWHSDFPAGVVTDHPRLRLVTRDTLPPLGMMTFLVLEKL